MLGYRFSRRDVHLKRLQGQEKETIFHAFTFAVTFASLIPQRRWMSPRVPAKSHGADYEHSHINTRIIYTRDYILTDLHYLVFSDIWRLTQFKNYILCRLNDFIGRGWHLSLYGLQHFTNLSSLRVDSVIILMKNHCFTYFVSISCAVRIVNLHI